MAMLFDDVATTVFSGCVEVYSEYAPGRDQRGAPLVDCVRASEASDRAQVFDTATSSVARYTHDRYGVMSTIGEASTTLLGRLQVLAPNRQ